MGKLRIEDLSDTPLSLPESTRIAEVETLLSEIKDLLSLREAQWAEETLEGIAETVERTGRVTTGQIRAVQNIQDQVDARINDDERRRRRRWR